MRLRSLLFVPGDRPDRFVKAAASGADALILDLEDSVVPARKAEARAAVAAYLNGERTLPLFVRVNPLDSGLIDDDLTATLSGSPDGLMLPKAEGAVSIAALAAKAPGVPILPVATETPAAMFQLGSYAQAAGHLAGLTWGAEDLPAAIGASTAREADGSYTAPYQLARSLTLFGAHAAGVPAIETVYPDFRDEAGLAAYAARGRRDGFAGMMAIHPAQVQVINAAFTPSDEELAHARRVVALFAADPDAGALQLDGRMVDAPHLKAARRLLASV
ncbi:MAG: CoA ester lyase [Sphingomonas bacterium]|uniref:HpcH/HpaI aldolase/citrate lyase family protein n=1 Tax=Sphingomonas bacterium TaxID=1895847 RepID=UPI00260CE8C8|nr:CoA ester lyase [Sphingomonas bacterium]MDB5696305.1 CoA ester lyase [Sphingomonas bacterium]